MLRSSSPNFGKLVFYCLILGILLEKTQAEYVSYSNKVLLGLPTRGGVDWRCSADLRGVSHKGRLIGGGARNQEPDGDTRRRDSDLDRFGPSDQHNTLRHVSLVYCIEYEIYGDVD